MRPGLLWPAAAALALAALPAGAAAQRLGVGVAGAMEFADHRVDMGYGPERSSGTLFESRITVEVGPRLAFAAVGRTGVLHPGPGATLPRELAEVGLDGTYRPRAWIEAAAGMRVRSYSTLLGRQRWMMPHVGVTARVPFALAGVQGLVGAALHPFAKVSGDVPHPEVAVSGTAGLQYTRGFFDVALLYAVDRYDFARGTGGQRLEQLSAVTLRVAARRRP